MHLFTRTFASWHEHSCFIVRPLYVLVFLQGLLQAGMIIVVSLRGLFMSLSNVALELNRAHFGYLPL